MFRESWLFTYAYYDDLLSSPGWKWLTPTRILLKNLASLGYEYSLRSGNCVYYLLLSRSIEHVLRDDQPYVLLMPLEDGSLTVSCFINGTREVELFDETVLTPRLRTILDHLQAQPIT